MKEEEDVEEVEAGSRVGGADMLIYVAHTFGAWDIILATAAEQTNNLIVLA